MISRERKIGVALGWTTLALTGVVEPLVGRGKHLSLYHWDGPPESMFGPVLLVFCAVWVASAGLLILAERSTRLQQVAWGSAVGSLPWLLANAVEHLVRPLPWLRTGLFAAGFVFLLMLLPGRWAGGRDWLERVMPRFTTAMLAIAFSGAIVLLQIFWFWWAARDLNGARALHARATTSHGSGPRGRIIWIVFDELSYRQVYEARMPGLQLPAFDALVRQSVVFTRVIPAGSKTDVVLPSLISGEPVAAIKATAGGDLRTERTDSSAWKAFNAQDSVFQDALNAGYSTGVAGWYNPYCRILASALDHCFWRMYTELDNGLSSSSGFRGNLDLLAKTALSGRGPSTASGDSELASGGRDTLSAGHLEDYKSLVQQADRLLDDPSANFLLLHLPVPHPDGIYDRRTGQFSIAGTSYLDNLVLADKCLAEMRARMERAGAWDGATVVLMGDHSWRVNHMWRQNRQRWTAEEERATQGGQFDDRPAYLVKLPRENDGLATDTPFQAVDTRELLDILMQGKLGSPEQLAGWVKGRSAVSAALVN